MKQINDWIKTFTDAFRRPEIKEEVEKMFKGKPRMKISQEELEGMTVRVCALLMRKIGEDSEQ